MAAKEMKTTNENYKYSAGRYELSEDTGIQIQVFWVGASEASRVYDNQKTKRPSCLIS